MDWKDVMPAAIPLARAVPVLESRFRRCIALKQVQHKPHLWLVIADPYGGLQEWAPRDLIVDLDTDGGFGYALGWLLRKEPHVWRPIERESARLLWTNGVITDADRLMLAKACAEVL